MAGYQTPSNGPDTFALARYNADGTLVSGAFGAPNGYVTTAFGAGASDDVCNAVAVQTDGQIVAAGSSFSNSKTVEDFIVASPMKGDAATRGALILAGQALQ